MIARRPGRLHRVGRAVLDGLAHVLHAAGKCLGDLLEAL